MKPQKPPTGKGRGRVNYVVSNDSCKGDVGAECKRLMPSIISIIAFLMSAFSFSNCSIRYCKVAVSGIVAQLVKSNNEIKKGLTLYIVNRISNFVELSGA